MKRYFFMFLFLMTLILSGCGKSEIKETYVINVPNTDSTYLELNWPAELPVHYTDNATYWEFNDGSVLYTSDRPDVEYDKENNTYVIGRKPDERRIIYTGVAIKKKEFESIVKNAVVVNNTIEFDKDKGLNTLPLFETKEIVLDENGMAMPSDFLEMEKNIPNYYSASLLLISPNNYLTAFILDRTEEEIKQELYNMVCSGTDIEDWYYNKYDGTLLIHSGDKYAVAKAIRTNEWYVYLGTKNYLDYMLSGVNIVSYAD